MFWIIKKFKKQNVNILTEEDQDLRLEMDEMDVSDLRRNGWNRRWVKATGRSRYLGLGQKGCIWLKMDERGDARDLRRRRRRHWILDKRSKNEKSETWEDAEEDSGLKLEDNRGKEEAEDLKTREGERKRKAETLRRERRTRTRTREGWDLRILLT